MKVLSLVILLMFLAAIAGGTMLGSATVMKYFDRSRSNFHDRETLKVTLDSIVSSFSDLVVLDTDDEQSQALENIRNRYAEYNLTVRDISSGCNLNFLPDAVLSEPALTDFLFAEGNVEGFLRFRRAHGFVTEISAWLPFVKEEAQGAVVCYGWLSLIHVDSETGAMLSASYGRSGEELYPVMNELPLININAMDTALLAPLLFSRSWRITGAAGKAAALKNRLENGPITKAELQSVLGLKEDHEVYRYLGVRTAFWGLSFGKGRYRMDAVIAAVPERGSKNIARYILIEGKLNRAS